jgi:hypothetical protein
MLTQNTKEAFLALLFGLGLGIILVELCAQAFYFIVVKKQFDAVKNSAYFYLQKSTDQRLGYELRPSMTINRDNKLLRINKFGIRATSDTTQKKKYRVGLLGDSVVFGINQTQDSTLSKLIEDIRQDSIEVCNLGVPGYATPQIVVQLAKYEPIYHFDEIVYLLNLNDFTLRNTMYEGADNGVYRYFNPPTFKSLWLFRKLIYRIKKKGETIFDTAYYNWVFDGTKDEIFNSILDLKKSAGAKFSVVILPSGAAYKNGQYELTDMVNEIGQFLKDHAIPYSSPVNEYSQNTAALLDETDHLTLKGNEIMAKDISVMLLK